MDGQYNRGGCQHSSPASARDHQLATYHYYDLLVHVFVVVLLISNLVYHP